jgi:hypothetical protein
MLREPLLEGWRDGCGAANRRRRPGEQVAWEQRRPEGGIIHIASFTADGLRVTDIWETADDFNRFVAGRLMPVVQEIGIEGEPDVTISELEAVWNPGVEQAAAARV